MSKDVSKNVSKNVKRPNKMVKIWSRAKMAKQEVTIAPKWLEKLQEKPEIASIRLTTVPWIKWDEGDS